MSTTTELHAFYRELQEALQRLIDTGRDIPLDELQRQSRLVGWARRDWQNVRERGRNHAAT